MTESETVDKVAAIFCNMGASDEQGQVMAAQLVKRSQQIAKERGISEVEALQGLLQQIVEQREL